MWCGVLWCSVVWCSVVWCSVVWCDVVFCGVVFCYGVMRISIHIYNHSHVEDPSGNDTLCFFTLLKRSSAPPLRGIKTPYRMF